MNAKMDMLEPGDHTAMICLESPEMQRIAIEQLTEHGYKVHTGFSLEDILLKLRAQTYDLLLVSEDFGGSKSAADNRVLREAVHQGAAQRHKQFVVLVGPYATYDELQAFEQSVDLVIGQADFVHLRPLLRRGLSRTQEFYAPYQDVLQATGKA
jgi:DNA-binding response OmpR family regulator